MLTKNTQNILKSILPISNSFIVSYPHLVIIDEFKSIIGKIDISKLEDDFDEFGIYDGTNFLNALDLLEDPEISLKDNLVIAKDKDSIVKFITSDPSSLEDSTISEEVITTTLAIDSVLEYDINADTLNRIKKAAGVFKTMDTLFINNPNCTMQIGAYESFDRSQNTYSIKVKPEVDKNKEFELPLPLENILKLPAVDYRVKIKYNEERDAYRVVFENEIYTFIISIVN